MKKLIEWIRQYRETGQADIEFEIHIGHAVALIVLLGILIYQCNA